MREQTGGARLIVLGLLALAAVALAVFFVLPRSLDSQPARASSLLALTDDDPALKPIGEDPLKEIARLLSDPELRARVRDGLALREAEFARYSVRCGAFGTTGDPAEFAISVSGPDRATAARICDRLTAALLEARKGEQLAQIRSAKRLVKQKMTALEGDPAHKDVYRLLKERLRDLREFERSVTGNLRVVRWAGT